MNATALQRTPVIRPLAALSRVLDALLLLPIAAGWLSLYEWDLPGCEAEVIAWAQASGLAIERDNHPAVPSMRVKRGGRILVVWHGDATRKDA